MPVPFGFSIGDFINCLSLLQKSVNAFSSANGASATLSQLEAELFALYSATGSVVELLEEGIIGSDQRKPIDLAVKACQKSIDDFIQRIGQYQKHLKQDNTTCKTSYMKIKWALCKQDDVAKLRSMLSLSAHPISIFLSAQQLRAIHKMNKTIEEHDELVKPGIEYEDQAQALSYKVKNSLTIHSRSMEAIEQHHCVSLSKFEDLQMSLQYRDQAIPSQVMLEQPIVLLDALGRIAPFHLEFVDSLEAFIAVMIVRFKQAGISESGLRKLVNHEFTLRDTRRKRPVDLTKPWRATLRPGQVIDMNMLYPTITYRLARLSVKNKKLLCYNFWFPCLTSSESQSQKSVTALIGPNSDQLTKHTQRYDRFEEFNRVHLILEREKVSTDDYSVPMDASALSNFMENVGQAFSISWQHLVVTVDSVVALEADMDQRSSEVCSMGRSSRRDFSRHQKTMRSLLPSDWDHGEL